MDAGEKGLFRDVVCKASAALPSSGLGHHGAIRVRRNSRGNAGKFLLSFSVSDELSFCFVDHDSVHSLLPVHEILQPGAAANFRRSLGSLSVDIHPVLRQERLSYRYGTGADDSVSISAEYVSGCVFQGKCGSLHSFLFPAANPPLLFFLAVLYGGGKYSLTRYDSLSSIQFLNQFLIFALLFVLFRIFVGLEQKLPRRPAVLRPVNILATVTLEIYLVQFPIINFFQHHTTFPVNWLLCSICILTAAFLLHYSCIFITQSCSLLLKQLHGRLGH